MLKKSQRPQNSGQMFCPLKALYSPLLLTLAAVGNEIEGRDGHHDQTHDQVRHGKAHDEHVRDGLEPLLGPDGVEDHPVPDSGEATEKEQGQAEDESVRLKIIFVYKCTENNY